MNGVTWPVIGLTMTMRELYCSHCVVGRLIGIGREEPPSRKTLNKGEINRRSLGLKTATIGGGLTYGTADLPSVFVEHQDIRGEGVIRSKLATRPQ